MATVLAPERPREAPRALFLGTTARRVAASPAEQLEKRLTRRDLRYRIRAQLRRFTTLTRLQHCGHTMAFGAEGVPLKICEGVAHFAQLQSCASPWACPVCGPKIRQRRADDMDEALKTATDRGMGVLALTLTCRHRAGEPLLDLRTRQEAAWKSFIQRRAWRSLMATGAGFVNQREVTYGEENGWHPHRHIAAVVARPLSDGEVEEVRARLWKDWSAALAGQGLTAEERWGLDLRHGDEALGDYMLKVRGKDQDFAMEIMRGDLKQGRAGRRTPEQILNDFLDQGDVADRDLWTEYEGATKGWRMTTGLSALRRNLGLGEEEPTDEEIVALEVGGTTLATLGAGAWAVVRGASPGGADLLRAAEAGTWRQYLMRTVGPGVGWHLGGASP